MSRASLEEMMKKRMCMRERWEGRLYFQRAFKALCAILLGMNSGMPPKGILGVMPAGAKVQCLLNTV